MRINSVTVTDMNYCSTCNCYYENSCDKHRSYVHHKDGNFSNNDIKNLWMEYWLNNSNFGVHTTPDWDKIFPTNNTTA